MKTRWYKDAVIYQIYPRSFCDSNGDGVGDLRGIISKLDYIKSLGVDAVWLSPIYKSPNDDMGYDISDYRDIMDEFGTLDDFKEMLKGMHDRGIKLIMDLVVNHTSDEHFWFKEAKKGKDNPYRDYYIWRKGRGKNGKKPPNNWTSNFVGPGWEYDENSKEWYLHLFSKKQPDLNWENPKVRQEVADICNYWFDMGVDGFRCDVITYISKEDGLPNGKITEYPLIGVSKYCMGPRYHEYMHELNERAFSKYDTMTVGEAAGMTFKDAYKSIDESVGELDSVFSFEHITEPDMILQVLPKKFDLVKFKKILSNWQTLPMTSQPTLFLENHDQPRSWPRFVNYCYDNKEKAAKMLLVAMQMQRGTPYIYQGQEIGMTNVDFKLEDYKDIMSIRVFDTVKKYLPFMMGFAKKVMLKRARDHARTPVQWNTTENAGFGSGTPWMMVNPNYMDVNVENEEKDPNSILNFYKKFLAFRKGKEIIISGTYEPYYEKSKELFVYNRKLGDSSYFVICNFVNKNVNFKLPIDMKIKSSKVAISNYEDNDNKTLQDLTIRPFEAIVFEVKY